MLPMSAMPQHVDGCRARSAGVILGRLSSLAGIEVPGVRALLRVLRRDVRLELMLPLQLLMVEEAGLGSDPADIDWAWFLQLQLPVVQVRSSQAAGCEHVPVVQPVWLWGDKSGH